MALNNKQVQVFYDPKARKLTVWFGSPRDEFTTEDSDEDFVLIKDKSGEVIGFKKLNYVVPEKERLLFAFEIASL